MKTEKEIKKRLKKLYSHLKKTDTPAKKTNLGFQRMIWISVIHAMEFQLAHNFTVEELKEEIEQLDIIKERMAAKQKAYKWILYGEEDTTKANKPI